MKNVADELIQNMLKNGAYLINAAQVKQLEDEMCIRDRYNALLGQYKEINGYENGAPTYKANGTLAKAKFDVIDKKGVLTATSKLSLIHI